MGAACHSRDRCLVVLLKAPTLYRRGGKDAKMLSWFIEKKLSSFERAFDYDLAIPARDTEVVIRLFVDGAESIAGIKRQVDAIVTHMLELGRKSQEIGGILGITRERVRQIKERALLRLRHASRSRFLETFIP